MSIVSIYFIQKLATDDYKIGITNNIHRRLRQIQTGNDNPLVIHSYIEFPTRNDAKMNEKRIHNLFSNKRKSGEWFHLDETDLDDLARIYDLLNN